MTKRITEDGEIINEVTHQVIAMAPPFWKTTHNHDRDHESLATGLTCKDPTRTQQSMAKDADINNIIRKFMTTGELSGNTNPLSYMNIEEEFDFQKQLVTAYEVEQAWLGLPAAARNILRDPRTFSDYVAHCLETGDLEPLKELGLGKPPGPGTKMPNQTEPKASEPPPPPEGGTPAPAGGKGGPPAP